MQLAKTWELQGLRAVASAFKFPKFLKIAGFLLAIPAVLLLYPLVVIALGVLAIVFAEEIEEWKREVHSKC